MTGFVGEIFKIIIKWVETPAPKIRGGNQHSKNDTISHAAIINVYSNKIIWRALLKTFQNSLDGNDLLKINEMLYKLTF